MGIGAAGSAAAAYAGEGDMTTGAAVGATLGAIGGGAGLMRMAKAGPRNIAAGRSQLAAGGAAYRSARPGFWGKAGRAEGMTQARAGSRLAQRGRGQMAGGVGFMGPAAGVSAGVGVSYATLASNNSPTMRDATLDQRLEYDRQRAIMRANINLRASAVKAQMWGRGSGGGFGR